MFAAILKMKRAGKILRVLESLSFRIVKDEKQVASAGFAAAGRMQATHYIFIPERFDVGGFVAEVKQARVLRLVAATVEFDELVIIYFDVRDGRFARISEFEGLFEAQGLVKVAGFLDVGNAKGHVSDSRQRRG